MRLAPDDDIVVGVDTADQDCTVSSTHASRKSCMPGRAHSSAGSEPSNSGLVSTKAEISSDHKHETYCNPDQGREVVFPASAHSLSGLSAREITNRRVGLTVMG
jgi:hypothetical protein